MYTLVCHNCSKTFLAPHPNKFCSRSCYHPPGRQSPLTKEQEEEVCRLYQERNAKELFLGIDQISTLTGIKRETVHHVLERYGIPRRPKWYYVQNQPHHNLKRIPPPGEQPPLCKCGCGQPTRWLQKKNRWAYYITGHYTHRGAQNHGFKGDPSELNSDGLAELTCPQCGKVFYRPAKRRGRTYCSNACQGAAKRSTHYDGNSRWNGWDKVRRRIRKRDNWTCQDCGYYGKNAKRALHVHHIDENPTNNADDNLVLVCLRCHHTRHGIVTPSDWPD